MIALPAPGQAIALPPPDSNNPDDKKKEDENKKDEDKKEENPEKSQKSQRDPDKKKTRSGQKRKNKGKGGSDNSSSRPGEVKDRLFGHLGVTAKPHNQTYSDGRPKGKLSDADRTELAEKLDSQNKLDSLKMMERRTRGLTEDLPEKVEELRRYLDAKRKAKEAKAKKKKQQEENGNGNDSDQKNDFLEDDENANNENDDENEANNADNADKGWSDEDPDADKDPYDQMPGTPERKDPDERIDPRFPNDQVFDYEDTLPSIESLTLEQQIALDRAKKYAMEQSVRNVLMNQEAQAKEMASSESHSNLMKQQALVYMCRVYIGSVYYEVREQHIRRAFGPFGPIKLVNMSLDPLTGKHKGFAFVEFELPEASQLAIEQMNGVLLCGRAIKIGRPTNMPQSMPIVEQIVRESQKAARIYVSSIHSDLTIDDIKSVFGAFGPIISVQLRPCAVTGNHAGYGFIEFETVQAANDAVQSMNLFDLGGLFLRVGKAMSPPEKDLMTGDAWKNPEELYVKKLQESGNIGGVTPQVAVAAAKVTTELMQLETVAKKEEAKKEESVKAELSKPKREGSKFGGKAENIAPVTTTVPSITPEQINLSSQPASYGKDQGDESLRGQEDRRIMMQKLEASKNEDSRVLVLLELVEKENLEKNFFVFFITRSNPLFLPHAT